MSDSDLDKFVTSLEVLGPTSKIIRPSGYANSLAMCVIDSIWSLSANYDRHVVPVLRSYALARNCETLQAVRDSPAELLNYIETQGGSEAFANVLGNRQRTSTRNGVLKAESVYEAARLLVGLQILDCTALLTNAHKVQPVWRGLPGQRSSATGWRYLLLLAGANEVKPDRMILGFVESAIGRSPSPDEARDLVIAAADRLTVDPAALDHAIWRYQRTDN